MSDEATGKPYKHAAGGWGSIAASVRHILKEKDVPRSVRSLLRVNQHGGFDCPGCAWPEPEGRSSLEFCENGVKAVAFETTGKRVRRDLFARHTVSELLGKTDHWLESQGRLTEPMRYDPATDRYVPVSWDEAFRRIGEVLKGLDDPHQALFYTSGRTSNEAAFLYQLFGRLFGTNNFPDCSNMCHESSGTGLTESIGVGKGTVQLEDFQLADAIFVLGQNPGTNHPRMLSELQAASRRGAKIVAVNPLRERGLERFTHPKEVGALLTGKSTPISALYLQPLVGGDLALLKGMVKCVLEEEERRPGEIVDQSFVQKHTSGFEAFRERVGRTEWETIETQSGLSREKIGKAAEIYIQAKAVIVCWAMGLTQHKHAVPTIQEIVNLLLVRGNLGRPGAGACPVRGHSNVQGDRTVGITSRPKADFLDRLGREFAFEPPREPGLDTVGAIAAMAERRARIFFAVGGNFAVATPDTEHTEAALRKCDLTAHVSTKLNRSHLVCGQEAFILPCLGRTEVDIQESGPQKVTVEDSMGVVHASQGRNRPASDELLSEPAIVARLAAATLDDPRVPWKELIADYARIREKIAAVIPAFAGYDEKIAARGGFRLRNAAREREWNTASSKAQFTATEVPDLRLPEGQLRLMTVRSHDQFNTTIYGLEDRYRGVSGTRRVIFLSPRDIESRGLRDGDLVDLTSSWPDETKRRATRGFRVVAYDIPDGCAAAYFPETNVLVSADKYADKSRTPVSKFIPVTVERSAEGDAAEGSIRRGDSEFDADSRQS